MKYLTTPGSLGALALPVLANRVVGLVAAVVKGDDTLLMKGFGRANVEWEKAASTSVA